MNYRRCYLTPRVKHLLHNRERCEMLRMGSCHWGADLTVSGRIRDIGQNVLQSSFFKQEAVAAPTYCHRFFLVAFLEEAFIKTTLIIQGMTEITPTFRGVTARAVEGIQ